MKKLSILFFLLTIQPFGIFGSPLIFKVTKSLNAQDSIELGSFDATKYRQIRIGIKVNSSRDTSDEKFARLTKKRFELDGQLRDLREKYTDSYIKIIETQNEIAKVNDEIKEMEKTLSVINIFGIEGVDELLLYELTGRGINRSFVIDTPPSKISVKVSGTGIYSLYVWGQ
jgi:peptidoglycan hydrolase CwlO-like protein